MPVKKDIYFLFHYNIFMEQYSIDVVNLVLQSVAKIQIKKYI